MRHHALLASLVCAALTMCGLCATPAHAGWRIDRATAIARIVWHNPCVDRMTVQWASATPEGITANATAWAFEDNSCVAWFNPQQPLAWEAFCDVLLHEAGHLAGARHSDNPFSVMFPVNDAARDWRCRDRGRPFLQAHGFLLGR